MTELQSKLVDVLGWFHDFCQKNGLKYYIIAGTLLGAVRHKGFIPWDDDIDVGMPRPEYERLRAMAKEKQDGRFRFEFPSLDNKEYPYTYGKVYDTTTTFNEKLRKIVKRGIYLDIFPIDGIGDDKETAIKNYKPIERRINLNSMISCAFLKRRSLKKNLAIALGRVISPLFVSKRKLVKKIDDLCKSRDFESSKIVSNLLGGSGAKGMMPKEYFGEPTPIQFESLTVYGLQQPEKYLSSMYGDYMTLPPEDKRVSLHDAVYCDLNKSYLE
ncbi:MAG: LicD family protein [Clostridia bacterium]|nr:LicD family protein [Clostridia bacterium]